MTIRADADDHERLSRARCVPTSPAISVSTRATARFETRRTPCSNSAHDRAGRLKTHRTPCTDSVYDRARRFHPPALLALIALTTVLTELRPTALLAPIAHDRARRLSPHRTPCTESADDRARRLMHHRTPCKNGAASRADKRCTPCIATGTSPVLARPLRVMGSLPLRPLLRQLLSLALRVLDFAILVEGHSHVRPPDRRLHRREDGAPRTDDPVKSLFPTRSAPTPVSQRHSPAARAQPRGGIARLASRAPILRDLPPSSTVDPHRRAKPPASPPVPRAPDPRASPPRPRENDAASEGSRGPDAGGRFGVDARCDRPPAPGRVSCDIRAHRRGGREIRARAGPPGAQHVHGTSVGTAEENGHPAPIGR